METKKESINMSTTRRQPDRVSDLEEHLGFWLRYVSNHVSEGFIKRLDAHGISGTEWVALRTLYGRSTTTHSTLIKALGMTKGAASKVITRLERKGLAHRRPVEVDGREQQLELTTEGMNLVPTLAALADENDAHFFGHLSQEERAALIAQMKDIVNRRMLKQIPTK
ncbi:MarR family winged helix-turn-helix transcriptional regulator [Undibacterium sp. TJN25]|uniref:MarR family winged helix-turn-helix transcriptional regulator n=1 Tax=Undibacterium sp. TJN25 TaxID=3413056 RepID=UPI003BF0F7F1